MKNGASWRDYTITSDAFGSVAQIIRADTGVIVARYNYDAYGNTTRQLPEPGNIPANLVALDEQQVNQPYRFQSHFRDNTSGLTDFGFRFYSTSFGRFINQDPLEEEGGINLYGFVGGNPTNDVDEDGLKPGDRFKTPDLAGIDAVQFINPLSIKLNREFVGRIYRNKNGTYSYIKAIKGDLDSSPEPGPIPKGTSYVAGYHTHGAYEPKYDSEYFSNADKLISENDNKPEYLGTPAGRVKKYIPKPGKAYGGKVSVLREPKKSAKKKGCDR